MLSIHLATNEGENVTDSKLEGELKDQMLVFAKALVDADLLQYYGGNLSVRIGESDLLISRTHTKKLQLSHDDIVRTGVYEDDENSVAASSALEIHREIYQRTDARAVIHAHPPEAISLSFFMDAIVPVDENGILYLGREVRVVPAPALFAWNVIAGDLADGLVKGRVVMHKWHGSFAKGEDLADAYHRTRAVEHASGQIIRLRQLEQLFGPPTPVPSVAVEVLGGIEGRVTKRVPS
jgi:L-fuculose-phosphate aldolase